MLSLNWQILPVHKSPTLSLSDPWRTLTQNIHLKTQSLSLSLCLPACLCFHAHLLKLLTCYDSLTNVYSHWSLFYCLPPWHCIAMTLCIKRLPSNERERERVVVVWDGLRSVLRYRTGYGRLFTTPKTEKSGQRNVCVCLFVGKQANK
jgi:hypothetical protein